MPEKSIPFVDKQASGFDELGGASPVAMNVVTDGAGVAYRRPGMTSSSAVAPTTSIDASGIVGIYKTLNGTVWAVGGAGAERPIYKVTGGGSTLLGGGVAPSGLRGSKRPTFAETEMLLVIAGGGDVEKIVLSTSASSRLGGSPPVATHVLANASRLLLNDTAVDKTKERFSDVAIGTTSFAGHEIWSLGGVGTSGYFTAEGKPDPIVAVVDDTNEVLCFGQTTLQSFQPDPSFVYSPVSTREIGCSAPYSVIKQDQTFYWLDHLSRFVMGNARQYQVISDPIQKTLDGLSAVSDCWGFCLSIGFIEAYVWVFPTDGRTFVYRADAGWGQWSSTDSSGDNYAAFAAGAFHLPFDATQPIVATTGGKVGIFSFDSATDFGTAIKASVTTGYQARETNNLKHCKCVRIVLRRGTTTSPVGPQAFLRYRDQPGAFGDPIAIDLGASGDTQIMLELRSLGVYRRRQWQFEYSGSEALGLVSATEEYDVLGQ